MYELVQISEMSYYINCPVKIGIYLEDSQYVYLIDSGNDKVAGRKVRQILNKVARRFWIFAVNQRILKGFCSRCSKNMNLN